MAKSTASGWNARLEQHGLDGRRANGLRGRPALLDADRKRLAKLLVKGPAATDFGTGVWKLPRVWQLVKREFGVGFWESRISCMASIGMPSAILSNSSRTVDLERTHLCAPK